MRVRNSIMRVREQVIQIAHCMHLVLDYEHNTDNSKDSSHIIINMRQPIVDIEHLIMGVRESILSATQPIMVISHTIMSTAN